MKSMEKQQTIERMDKLMRRLFPICRSITGEGVRQTLGILSEYIPLEIREAASGARAFDWTVPREWNIRDAYIKGPDGQKIVDFQKNNLHVMSYSAPVSAKMTLAELRPHLYSLPDQPDLVPYRTSYYDEGWGFCLSHNVLQALPEGEYEAVIDSELKDGSLTYGEYYLPGTTKDEILFSAYVCHPSMANDNLSGVVLAAFLARELAALPRRRYSYRFLFAPETIGALVWLSQNERHAKRVKHGLVMTCVGDAGAFTYKKSRQGAAEIDRAVMQVLRDSGQEHNLMDFYPYGSDERQYCSPGFDLPVGCFMRTSYGKFPQYHTSADDLSFANGENIQGTMEKYLEVIALLEKNRRYRNLYPKGEPMLGRRGLYKKPGGAIEHPREGIGKLWVLNQSDGTKSLLDIAERSGLKFSEIAAAAEDLLEAKLIKVINS